MIHELFEISVEINL